MRVPFPRSQEHKRPLAVAMCLVLPTSPALGAQLCADRPPWEGDTGRWIEESELTAEAAEKALELLRQYHDGSIRDISVSGWELDVAAKFAEGFAYKRLAELDPSRHNIHRFCYWLERSGFELG